MKFFTPECDTDDDLWEERCEAYDDYIDSIYSCLPWPLKILASGLDLHDGFFTKALYYKDQKSLELEGIFGDLEMGYFFLHLVYQNLECSNLEAIFDGSVFEIIFDEVEWLENKRYAHRMRFCTGKDLDLEFSDLVIKVKSIDTMQRLIEKPCPLTIL